MTDKEKSILVLVLSLIWCFRNNKSVDNKQTQQTYESRIRDTRLEQLITQKTDEQQARQILSQSNNQQSQQVLNLLQ